MTANSDTQDIVRDAVQDQRYEGFVLQEEDRLRNELPTPEDIPGCIKLFDDYLLCNVMASQGRSLYRYGQLATCQPKMEDVKFCLSSSFKHPEERRDAWIQRRAEWWARRRVEKSSEDVWDVRTEPLKSYPSAPSNSDDKSTFALS